MTILWTDSTRFEQLIVTVTGGLRLDDVVALRVYLMKCLADQPESMIVDLTSVHIEEPLALSVFTAVTRQAARWPGIPLALVADTPEIRSLLRGGAYRHLLNFPDLESASRHVNMHQRSLSSISDEILPVSGAPWHARRVATDALVGWDLPDLVDPARLIVNELVTNVIQHANTMATLRVSLRARHVAIAVRDGSTDPPVLSHGPAYPGRGLMLVDAFAASWGFLPTDGGKVVWATLQCQVRRTVPRSDA